MKKLFSSMLAATMVAGMGVTAFATTTHIDNPEFGGGTRTNFGQDYGLIGAYDEDGNIVNGQNKKFVDGGDKLYFPILVCGEELDDEATGQEDDMFFVTKRSDIDDLKASVKDEIGGKYIDNADIVKKDINISLSGETGTKDEDAKKEIFTVDLSGMTAGSEEKTPATLAQPRAFSAEKITGWDITNNEDYSKDKTETKSDVEVTLTKSGNDMEFAIGSVKGTIADVATCTGEQTVTLGHITIKITEAVAQNLAEGPQKIGTVSAYVPESDAVMGGKDITFTIDGEDVTVTGLAENADATAIAKELAKETFSNYDAASVGSVLTFTAKTAKVMTDATVSAKGCETPATSLKTKVTQQGENGKTGVKAFGKKIYCVEVEMADYYKSEETEVEFNIKLKNNGRTEFDSEDDALSSFVADFDLGQDSKELVNNDPYVSDYEVDFDKDGDLELEIGPDTRSVQLDEAKVKADEKSIDIETIFLESADEIDCAFTFDVKASGQDDLYLELNDDAVKDLAVSNQKADLTFFNFPGEPEFDFSGDATFAVEDDDEDYYFYEIVDGELVETNAKYDSRDGVFKLRTNKLGSYVISDKELDTAKEEDEKDVNDDETKTNENGGGDATADAATPSKNAPKANANTGAADLIGVASALAVVSVAAAGAVALKK